MVSCKQCTASNSLDSAFCKRCGATLDQQELADATAKLTTLIADGNKLYADGRTDEAMLVAERAVLTNPSSPAALSLKGMCHERVGQVAEALECFEKVVELNPNSTLDRIKVNDLKNLIVARNIRVVQAPNQRYAVVASIAAAVLVISIGAALARTRTGNNADAAGKVAQNNATGTDPKLETFGNTPAGGQPQTQQQPQPNSQPNTNSTPQNGASSSPAPRRDSGPQPNFPDYSGSGLPKPGGSLDGPVGYTPFPVASPPTSNDHGTKPAPNGTGGGKTTTGGDGIDPPPIIDKTQPDPPKEAPGIYELTMSNGSKGNGGGSTSASNGNSREALVRAARNEYQLTHYQAAANMYERALRAGAPQGSTNQRLGQCYEKLNRSSDAIAAYTRAANAFETVGSKAAADSCRQAIHVLNGS